MRRAIRRSLAGAAALAAVAAVIAVPHLAGRAEPAPPPTAPPIPGAPLPTPAAAPAGGEPAAEPAPPPLQRLVPPSQGALLGVSNPTLPREAGAVDEWTAEHGVAPRIVNWFQQWLSGETRFRADWAARVAEQGAVPMITWEPWSAPAGETHEPEQPDVSLARIAAGDHDGYIRSFAREVAAYRGPVLLRPMHEMNGNWFSWGAGVNGNTPADFVAAWRHVHRVFAQEGARNVSWIWSINNLESADAEAIIADLYPGDPYVDWVSTSGFNWGEAYDWSSWRDADALYGTTYRALARFGMPIMISEIATTDLGGDPEGWITQTLARLRAGYPLVRAVVWYDDIDGAGLDFRLRGATTRALASRAATGDGWLQDPDVRYLAP
ncbi:MAG TPA: glycosyl hydrolase [Miltoncostaeaceae bacterium]|nr:glycosyl hydrolase [Miltoncostaeaceae bacterium]